MQDDERLRPLLESSGALRQGHFVLSSGLHSPAYVQCALLLEEPRRARQVAAWLAERLVVHHPQSVLSPALGGVIIGHEVAAALGVPFRFVERRDGAMQLRRGFHLPAGQRVIIVEDVVTTGKSTLETVAVARAEDAEVVALGALIDRTGSASPFEMPFDALLRLRLPTYPAAECPACRRGDAPDSPGSRR